MVAGTILTEREDGTRSGSTETRVRPRGPDPSKPRRSVPADVFSDRMFHGNPVAVVLEAKGLSPAQMQNIAREFNYVESTFVLPPDNPAHTARVRIFTPV